MVLRKGIKKVLGLHKPEEAIVKKRILIIDDDENSVKILIKCLGEHYESTSKSDGSEALNYLESGEIPDLIILDIEMPNMNGRVFLRQIKCDTRINKIPIIIISSNENSLSKSSMNKSDIVAYFVKPIRREPLLEKIKEIFNQ